MYKTNDFMLCKSLWKFWLFPHLQYSFCQLSSVEILQNTLATANYLQRKIKFTSPLLIAEVILQGCIVFLRISFCAQTLLPVSQTKWPDSHGTVHTVSYMTLIGSSWGVRPEQACWWTLVQNDLPFHWKMINPSKWNTPYAKITTNLLHTHAL